MTHNLTAHRHPKNGMYKIDTPAPNPYKEFKPIPQKPVRYQDPLKNVSKTPEYKPYKFKPIKLEYTTYDGYKEYRISDIDPLTGKPYKSHKVTKKEPKTVVKPPVLPKSLGSTVGCIKRTFKIEKDLKFV